MSWSWPWATPRLCPNRDGSSLPLEEAGDGHLSIGFAQSRCPFLWAPSFLFGLLFHGHGGRPGHRGSLRLELFLTIGAGFTLVDFSVTMQPSSSTKVFDFSVRFRFLLFSPLELLTEGGSGSGFGTGSGGGEAGGGGDGDSAS